MIATPAASASRVEAKRTGVPRSRISPPWSVTTPASTFIRVLLPAPFSPQTACSDPAATSNDTPPSAAVPPYRLLTPRSETSGSGMGPR